MMKTIPDRKKVNLVLVVFSLFSVLLVAFSVIAQTPCDRFHPRVDDAISRSDHTALLGLYNEISMTPECPETYIRQVGGSTSDLVARRANELSAQGDSGGADALLARAPVLTWSVAAVRGDIAAEKKDWEEAAELFNRAYEIAVDPAQTQGANSDAMRQIQKQLFNRAAESQLLVGHLDNTISRSGEQGGILGSRGPKPEFIPIPVRFEFGKYELSPQGESSARRLATYIKQKQPRKIELIGHTDPVGDDASNQVLSENRARTLKAFLISEGVNAVIDDSGRGESQPPRLSDPGQYNQKELHTLYRRVEFKVE